MKPTIKITSENQWIYVYKQIKLCPLYSNHKITLKNKNIILFPHDSMFTFWELRLWTIPKGLIKQHIVHVRTSFIYSIFLYWGKKQVRTLLLVLKTSLRKLLMEYWNILSWTVFHWSSWNIRGNSVDICYDKIIWAERFMQTYF